MRYLLLLVINLSFFSAFSQESSFFFNGINYHFEQTSPELTIKATYTKGKIIVHIAVSSKNKAHAFDEMKICIVGKEVENYRFNTCDTKKNKDCSSFIQANWYDENGTLVSLNSLELNEIPNGIIKLVKLEEGKIDAKFYIIADDKTIEGKFKNIVVENLK
jgi:hypothetical protein